MFRHGNSPLIVGDADSPSFTNHVFLEKAPNGKTVPISYWSHVLVTSVWNSTEGMICLTCLNNAFWVMKDVVAITAGSGKPFSAVFIPEQCVIKINQ